MADRERSLAHEKVLSSGLTDSAGPLPPEGAPESADWDGPEIFLRVAEALPGDVDRGLARMDPLAFEALRIRPGDLAVVLGRRVTTVRVEADPAAKGRAQLRLDGLLRDNAQTGVDDRVSVRPGLAGVAETVSLGLPEPGSYGDDDLACMQRELESRVVSVGDLIKVAGLGRGPQVFRVLAVQPHGPAVVTRATSFHFDIASTPRSKGFQVRYENIGGLEDELRRVRELIELPIKYPSLFSRLRLHPPRGVLLYGPPGTGKTLIARAVASEVEAEFIHINGPEIMQKFYGESEARLREIFDEAQRKAPSIIFLDEIDALAPKRVDVTGEVEKRVVAQLLALMDGLVARGQVVVIGATNLPDMVDPALRRPGRFDREIPINVPNRLGRLHILRIHSRGMPLADDVELERLAEVTHGFVGADLEVLCKEAGMLAVHELLDQAGFDVADPGQSAAVAEIHLRHFQAALRSIEPTATREVFVDKPNVRWSEVGGLKQVREFLESAVVLPRRQPELFREAGIRPPKGILFSGPSGTGKTLVARVLACETGMSLITADAAAIFSKWVGESEKTLRKVFLKAKQAAPSLLFFDEIDALSPVRRSGDMDGVTERIIGQFLGELDHLDELCEVVVLAATNRLDLLEPALLTPGRIGYVLEFPLPDEQERRAIFAIHAARMPLADDVDLGELAAGTDGFTGATLAAVCQRAAMEELHALLAAHPELAEAGTQPSGALPPLRIGQQRFRQALAIVRRSLSKRAATEAQEAQAARGERVS